AARGYKVILTMPETMSTERRVMLRAYGAEIDLTPGSGGMRGAGEKAKEIVATSEDAIWAQHFPNEANPVVHYATTRAEIWGDTDGAIDILVAGTGTGAGRFLKEKKPELQIVAVEPADSPILTGGNPRPHQIQGLGANLVPEIPDTTVYHEVLDAPTDAAVAVARELGTKEGILGGISSGASVWAALQVAERPENAGKLIVAVVPDFGERYISTILYDDIRG
ncbi:pyridoxal-phosphate dependent enzyme, partial [Arthrobacter deserti]|nr:pyridoxal-phosphate dependent enzyme [Arthrobacter deserti]